MHHLFHLIISFYHGGNNRRFTYEMNEDGATIVCFCVKQLPGGKHGETNTRNSQQNLAMLSKNYLLLNGHAGSLTHTSITD